MEAFDASNRFDKFDFMYFVFSFGGDFCCYSCYNFKTKSQNDSE